VHLLHLGGSEVNEREKNTRKRRAIEIVEFSGNSIEYIVAEKGYEPITTPGLIQLLTEPLVHVHQAEYVISIAGGRRQLFDGMQAPEAA
jgi:hypothetical protein